VDLRERKRERERERERERGGGRERGRERGRKGEREKLVLMCVLCAHMLTQAPFNNV